MKNNNLKWKMIAIKKFNKKIMKKIIIMKLNQSKKSKVLKIKYQMK